MKITKELALALDFSSAPTEVKAAAKKQKDLLKRLHKANSQFKNWRVEKQTAQAEYDAAFADFEKIAESWNPDLTLEVK